MDITEHESAEVFTTWRAARTAILDQVQALEEDTPCVSYPWGIAPCDGNVYFAAPSSPIYTLDNPRPFVYYRRSREPGQWPGDKVRSALLCWKDGQLELAPWQPALKLPFGWRAAVIIAYALRDERIEREAGL
jgi:hypothetical protein